MTYRVVVFSGSALEPVGPEDGVGRETTQSCRSKGGSELDFPSQRVARVGEEDAHLNFEGKTLLAQRCNWALGEI